MVPETIIRDPGLPGARTPAVPNTFEETPVENMPFPIKEQELPNY